MATRIKKLKFRRIVPLQMRHKKELERAKERGDDPLAINKLANRYQKLIGAAELNNIHSFRLSGFIQAMTKFKRGDCHGCYSYQ